MSWFRDQDNFWHYFPNNLYIIPKHLDAQMIAERYLEWTEMSLEVYCTMFFSDDPMPDEAFEQIKKFVKLKAFL
jgi:hypothetical protein